jgi:XTP/dITP diphosphohydrolase
VKGELLFASTNPGKLSELRGLLGQDIHVYSPVDFPQLPVPSEDGETFEENARHKALIYARAAKLPALADDSGLCVEALGGRPGVHSARYAPGSDSDRNQKLLAELAAVPGERRSAAFVCALCLGWPDGRSHLEVGRVEGRIGTQPVGNHGFGYDPVFYLPEMGRSMAELSPHEKSRISHRGRAFEKMRPHLLALIRG